MLNKQIRWFTAALALLAVVLAACGGSGTSGSGGAGGSPTTTTSSTGGAGGTGGTGGATATYESQDEVVVAPTCNGQVKPLGIKLADNSQAMGVVVDLPVDLPYFLAHFEYSVLTGAGPSGNYNCKDMDHSVIISADNMGVEFPQIGGGASSQVVDKAFEPKFAVEIPAGAKNPRVMLHWFRGPNGESLCPCAFAPATPDPWENKVFVTFDQQPPFTLLKLLDERPTWRIDDLPNGPLPPPSPSYPSFPNADFSKFLTMAGIKATRSDKETWHVSRDAPN